VKRSKRNKPEREREGERGKEREKRDREKKREKEIETCKQYSINTYTHMQYVHAYIQRYK
jgi:hypothetical protein